MSNPVTGPTVIDQLVEAVEARDPQPRDYSIIEDFSNSFISELESAGVELDEEIRGNIFDWSERIFKAGREFEQDRTFGNRA